MILQGMQFGQEFNAPMTFIGAMQSGNNPDMTVEGEYQAKKQGKFDENDYARLPYDSPGSKTPKEHQDKVTQMIDEQGQLSPVQFSSYKGSKPSLDEGYHRYAAHRDLGLESIRAKYYGDVHE